MSTIDVDAMLKRLHLRHLANAAVDHRVTQGRVLAVGDEAGRDLRDELTGRGEH